MDETEQEQMNYEEDLDIDPSALDVECITQPNTFMKWGKASARANAIAKRADENVKTIRSQLILKCHQDPEGTLGEGVKMSDPKAEAFYRAQPSYREAVEEKIKAEYRAEILTNAVFAFHQRKAMLEGLSNLHQQHYCSGPSQPRDLAQEKARGAVHKRVSQAVKEHTQRRRTA